ncbi:hypothetical protein HRG84_06615, partial [Flavisolibacter sp. BT320]|nr:hypothetical protein [Flavisolibacter longurius]
MRSEAIAVIKGATERRFGKKILSYKECVELNQDIYKKTGELLSVPTLRRLFGLVRSSSLPSFSTLQTLANYCGYSSVDEAIARTNVDSNQHDNSLVNYISYLFREVTVEDPYDSTYTQLVYHTIHFLQREPHLVEPILQAVAKTINGQQFYFERFIHIDKLAGYYGNGLQFYLAENQSPEGQVFGHSLLAFRYWLTMEDKSFLQHADAVLRTETVSIQHPFLGGRYFVTLLYKTKLENRAVKPVLEAARKHYLSLQTKEEDYQRFPSIELTIGTGLLLMEEWEELLYYVNRALRKKEHGIFSAINRPFLHSFYLYKAFALYKTGKMQEALQFYEMVNSTEFHFLARQI